MSSQVRRAPRVVGPVAYRGSVNTPARPHPHLKLERDGDVLTVTLDAPERLNAQTPSLWLALAEVAAAVDGSDHPASGARFVVLRGAGRAFSAGMDRRMLAPGGMSGEPDLLAVAAADAEAAAESIGDLQRAFSLWRECSAIVIAVVQGHAIGAGFQLALAADLRVVTEDVQFVMAEPSLGLVPDLGGTAVLTELVGYSRALEICLTSRPVGAAEAVAVGLASIAVPVEQLEDTLADLLGALRAAPEASVRATKALLAGAATRTRGQQLAAERTAQVALLRGIAKSRGRPR